jgi:ArsR family metal-binding transcriptional regulator
MTAVSEGEIYSQYAQSNTGKQCTDQACVTNFIKILDNPVILLSVDEVLGTRDWGTRGPRDRRDWG